MKGAQNLKCECGGYFVATYTRNLLGKIETLYECTECTRTRKITTDGHLYKVELAEDGVVTSSKRCMLKNL